MARVLVIDDQPFVLEVLRRLLEAEGHQVVTARDGEVGLILYRQQRADLVLCDLFLPGMDGPEVIRMLKGEFPAARVVAMTGGSFGGEIDLASASLDNGAAGFLLKPFAPGALASAVAQALRAPGG
jgi:CheY-like chemotaxis protein